MARFRISGGNGSGNDLEAANARPIPARGSDRPEQSHFTVYTSLMAMVLSAAAMKYQNVDPFMENPTAMMIFVLAMFAYLMLHAILKSFDIYHDALNQLAMIIGGLAWYALSSILLPPKLLWIPLVSFFVFTAIVAHRLLVYFWGLIKKGCFQLKMLISATTFIKWFKDEAELPT